MRNSLPPIGGWVRKQITYLGTSIKLTFIHFMQKKQVENLFFAFSPPLNDSFCQNYSHISFSPDVEMAVDGEEEEEDEFGPAAILPYSALFCLSPENG